MVISANQLPENYACPFTQHPRHQLLEKRKMNVVFIFTLGSVFIQMWNWTTFMAVTLSCRSFLITTTLSATTTSVDNQKE